MSEECTHDCGSCGADCPSRGQAQPESLLEKPHAGSAIKKVIAVVSGKGGVGKSLVTSLMAVNMRRREYQTAILDADITGPGTGDVPLTVFQSLPVDGLLIVTSPQELVSMIVEKAVNMAALMNVPVLGIIENMSYYICPDCGARHSIYGESHIDGIAAKHGIPVTARLPIDPKFAAACDKGTIELFENDALDQIADQIEKL